MTRARDLANFADGTIGDVSGNLTGNVNGLTPQASNMQPFNRIINGAMTVDQRNAGASVTPTANVYVLDRWNQVALVTSKYSVQQNAGSVTPPVGFTNYLGMTSLSAYTVGAAETFALNQRIEGYNISDLGWGTANAKTVTLSFWVRSSLTGTFGGALKNSTNDRSYPFAYTISAANTWEYETITIAGDTTGTWLTTNGVGINLIFGIGVGSTASGTAGAWAAANYNSATGATSVVGTSGATFYITGVQLEAGSTASPFAHENVGDTLQKCQRYFQTLSAIANAGYASGNNESIMSSLPFKTSMRSAPTVTITSLGNQSRLQAFTANGATVDGVWLWSTASSSGFAGVYNATATAVAEL